MNIVDPILFQCKYHPPGLAICAPGEKLSLVSYGRLERLIHNATRKAMALGFLHGQTIAIFIHDRILHAVIALALSRLGIVTFTHRSLEFPKELRVDAIISDQAISHSTTKIHVVDQSWIEGDGQPVLDAGLYRGCDDDICRIVLTSGTTGEPKAVGLTHRMLAARMARHGYTWGNRFSQCSRIYCDLGFGTSLGFQFLIYTLSRGGTIFLAGASVEETIQAFDLYKVQAMMMSPSSLAGFTKFYEQASVLQSGFELIITGGSLLPKSLSERARARLCANVISSYGSTEASMVATAPTQALVHISDAVGYVLPDISVEVVDAQDSVLKPGAEGRLRIRGAYNTNGYLGDRGETESAFRDGWFYPGDIGYLSPDGILVITGREKTVLNVGGDKVKPETVEDAVLAFPGVEQAGAFQTKNEFGVDELCVALIAPRNLDENHLRQHCERRLPSACVPVRFLLVDNLPRNAMGKLEREKLSLIVGTELANAKSR